MSDRDPLLPPAPTYDERVQASARAAEADDRNPGRDPGKTLGIIGLVLAIPVALAGLVFSIAGVRKSKKAGRRNGLAWAGIVVSTLVILVSFGAAIVGPSLWHDYQVMQACAVAGPGEYTDQDGNPVTCR